MLFPSSICKTSMTDCLGMCWRGKMLKFWSFLEFWKVHAPKGWNPHQEGAMQMPYFLSPPPPWPPFFSPSPNLHPYFVRCHHSCDEDSDWRQEVPVTSWLLWCLRRDGAAYWHQVLLASSFTGTHGKDSRLLHNWHGSGFFSLCPYLSYCQGELWLFIWGMFQRADTEMRAREVLQLTGSLRLNRGRTVWQARRMVPYPVVSSLLFTTF